MQYTATPSRLTVLLLTDIVGSTDLKTRLGLSEYARLLARHDSIFKQLIEATPYSEILKDTGDGYFASFATTSDAVRFALRFQHVLHHERWANEPLRVRVGIHVGEVAQMEKESTGKPKLVGLAADLVSRVTHLATGGQILLTRFAFNEARQFVSSHPVVATEYAGVVSASAGESAGAVGLLDERSSHGHLELKWVAHGPYRFKGLDEDLEIFEVGVLGIAPLSAPKGGEDARRAIAIGDDETLGWRPAVGLQVPGRPHWDLELRLGEGGFGEVWLARHRKLGTRRAFKFCFDVDRLRSFKRELTLFRLLHETLGERPDIARIYEVKLDEPPYFLESEYTEGGNLQDWSDMEGGIGRIALAARIDILVRVADAVAASHSVGVLHKDIKPSNILIAIESGQPRPQLADFGIGMITDRSRLQRHAVTATGFTQFTKDMAASTQTGTRLYTPPEVLVGKPFTVQGDIYALGVMLYQMIVADLNRPLAEGWQRDVEDELLREDIAACVDGDPDRRLTSASDLGKRLRSLAHRRQWKQQMEHGQRQAQRRQRLGRIAYVTAASLLVLLTIVGFFAIQERSLRRQAEAARQAEADQRAIADAVGRFLMDMMLSVSPDTGAGRDVTVLQTLDSAAQQLDQKKWHPEVEAYLRNTLGTAYRTLGEPKLAEPHARRAVELIEKLKGETNADTHLFRAELATIMSHLGQARAAEPLMRAALEGMQRTLGPEHKATLHMLNDYVLCLLSLHREADAEPFARQLVEIRSRTAGSDEPETLDALNTFAGLQFQRGRYAEARDVFERVYESRRRTSGEDHPTTIAAAHNYSALLSRTGRIDDAIAIMRNVVVAQERALGREHSRTLDAMTNLAEMTQIKGETGAAIEIMRTVAEIRTRKFGEAHPDAIGDAAKLGGMMASDPRYASEAEVMLRRVIELAAEHLPENDPQTMSAMNALARSLESQNRLDEAEPLFRQVVERSQSVLGAQHPYVTGYRVALGRCLIKMQRYEEAEPVLLAAIESARSPAAPNPAQAARIASLLVELYEKWNKPQLADKYRGLLPATGPS